MIFLNLCTELYFKWFKIKHILEFYAKNHFDCFEILHSINHQRQYVSYLNRVKFNFIGNGYPDDGNGLYTSGLSYPSWHDMNVVKRIRINNVEQIWFMAPFSVSLRTLLWMMKLSLIYLVACQWTMASIHHIKPSQWIYCR